MRREILLISLACAVLSLSTVARAQSQSLNELLLPAAGETAQEATAESPPAEAEPARNEADRAFEEALRGLMPMTPSQIEEFKRAVDQTRRSAETPVVDAKPVSRPLALSLKPGEEAPVIRLSPGHASTVTFSDLTGKSWPVRTVTIGNPDAYVAQSAGSEGETNIIVLSTMGNYAPSNLVVTLVGHPVPIIATLKTGEEFTDYRVDIQVEARGPNASYDVMTSSLPPTGDSTMLSFLDGVPPEDAVRMETGSSDVEAWQYDDMLYVRTKSDLLSPAYVSKSNSVSGTKVYALIESPVLIVSNGGQMRTVSVGR